MDTAPTQPEPAEGAPDDGRTGQGGGPSAPTQPQPAEGDDAVPGEGPGSPAG